MALTDEQREAWEANFVANDNGPKLSGLSARMAGKGAKTPAQIRADKIRQALQANSTSGNAGTSAGAVIDFSFDVDY